MQPREAVVHGMLEVVKLTCRETTVPIIDTVPIFALGGLCKEKRAAQAHRYVSRLKHIIYVIDVQALPSACCTAFPMR
jgi:hypothetical protein